MERIIEPILLFASKIKVNQENKQIKQKSLASIGELTNVANLISN